MDDEAVKMLDDDELENVSGGFTTIDIEEKSDLCFLRIGKCPECQLKLVGLRETNKEISGICIRCDKMWNYKLACPN